MATLTGDEFVAELDRYKDEFYRYVRRQVWNASTADDVFSSAVLAAYQQLGKFEAGTNFRAWMYRILTNKCYVANRHTQRSAIDLDSISEDRMATEDGVEEAVLDDPAWFFEQCGDEVYQALDVCSSNERSCLLLLSIRKCSYKEIAEILDMPVGTVMTHLARGRAKLRNLLFRHAREEGIISAEKAQELAHKGREKDGQ